MQLPSMSDGRPLAISGVQPAATQERATMSQVVNPHGRNGTVGVRTEIARWASGSTPFFVAANDGNIVRLNEDEVITPTTVSKGFANPEDIIAHPMGG